MRLKLSHAFINAVDVAKVGPFYTGIPGFQITDRGDEPQFGNYADWQDRFRQSLTE